MVVLLEVTREEKVSAKQGRVAREVADGNVQVAALLQRGLMADVNRGEPHMGYVIITGV